MGTLRTSEIFNDSRLRIIAIESVDFRHNKTNAGYRMHGTIEPIAIVICGPDATYALDMKANPVNFDQLREELPELDTMIAPSDNTWISALQTAMK